MYEYSNLYPVKTLILTQQWNKIAKSAGRYLALQDLVSAQNSYA